MAMSVKVGDFVSITDQDHLHGAFNYKGRMKLNMIAKVVHVSPLAASYFNVEDDDGDFRNWIAPRHVDVLEPNLFNHIELSDFSHLLCVKADDGWFTKGNYYEIESTLSGRMMVTDDECDTWYNGDVIHGSYLFVGVTQEQFDATHGVVAEKPLDTPTADVLPSPTPTRTAFKDLSDAEKGALLLAHHDGKPLQWYHTNIDGLGVRWIDDDEVDFTRYDDKAYRVKPQELIDAEADLEKAKADQAGFLVTLDEKRRELQALEEKAATYSESVDKATATIKTLNAA